MLRLESWATIGALLFCMGLSGCAAPDGADAPDTPRTPSSAAQDKVIQDPPVVCDPQDPACREATIDFDQNDVTNGDLGRYGDGVVYNMTDDGIQVDTTAGQLETDADSDGVPDIADDCPTDSNGWIRGADGKCTKDGVYVELGGTPGAPDASKDVDATTLFDFFKADIYVLAEASSDSFLATGGNLANVLTRGSVDASSDADLMARLQKCNSGDVNGKGVFGAAQCILPGSWFGFGQFTDYNIANDNRLYFHLLDMTDNLGDLRQATQKMTEEKYAKDANGATQVLWAMATGMGLGNYLPGRGVCPSYAEGPRTGWPCFRPDAIKLAVLLHYAPFHNGPPGAQWTDSTGGVHNVSTYPYGGGSINNSRAQPANMVPVEVWPQLLYNDGPRTISSPQGASERGIYNVGNLTRSFAYNTNTVGNRKVINPAGRFRSPALVDHSGDIGDCAVTGSIYQDCSGWWAQTFAFCQQINGSWINYNTLAQDARGNAWFYFGVPSSQNVLIHTDGSDRDMALGTFLNGSAGSWNSGPLQLECNDYGGSHNAISLGNGSGYNGGSPDTAAVRRGFAAGNYYAVVSSIGIGGKWPQGGPGSVGYNTGDGNVRLTFDIGSGYQTTHLAPISYNDVISALTSRGIKVIDVPLTLNGACPSSPGWISSWVPTSWTQSLDDLLRTIFFPGTAVGGLISSATGAVDAGGNPASYATCNGATQTQLNVLRALRDITSNTPFDLYIVPMDTDNSIDNFDERNLIGRIPASATVGQAAAGSALWDIRPKDCATCGGTDTANNMCTQCLPGTAPTWTIHFQNSGPVYNQASNPTGTSLLVQGAPQVRNLTLFLYADPDAGVAGDEVLAKKIPVRVFIGKNVKTPTGTFTLLYDTARHDPMTGKAICKVPPERPLWQNLTYDAKVPLGTQLVFEFKTANSTPDLMDPSKSTTITIPVVHGDDFDGTGMIDVGNVLPSAAKQLPVLQIQAKLISAPAQVVAALSPPTTGGSGGRTIGTAPSGFTFEFTRMNTYHVGHQFSPPVPAHDEYCPLDTVAKADLLLANSTTPKCGKGNAGNYTQSVYAKTYAVPTIDFNAPPTNRGYPGYDGGDTTNFATRATADLIVRNAGTYQFGILSDDGVRLKIDGTTAYTSDAYMAAERIVSVALTAGRHTLELVNFNNTGGYNIRLRVNDPGTGWRVLDAIDTTMPGVSDAGFSARVVNQTVTSLSAADAALANNTGFTTNDLGSINFADGNSNGLFGADQVYPGDPDNTVNETIAYSPVTKVTAKLRVPVAGTYRFGVWADDGVRLKIDGSVVISQTACCQTYAGDYFLAEGTHDLELVSYDSGGGAALELFMLNQNGAYGGGAWQLITRAPQAAGTTELFLDAGVRVLVNLAGHSVVMGSLKDVGVAYPGMGPYRGLIRGAWFANGKIWFYLTGTSVDPPRVARVDATTKTLDPGFPKPFAAVYPSLAPYQNLLVSFTPAPNGRIYSHLADGRYLATDLSGNLLPGYPATIDDSNWPVLNTVSDQIGGASPWEYGVDVWLKSGGVLRYDWPPTNTNPRPTIIGTTDLDQVGTFVPTLRKLHFQFFCEEVE
ncbi:MAG: hypothetical protein KC543_01410 [Myxococcales bacterium]|nr:hypothetical protein [Myxococcales bacterium]